MPAKMFPSIDWAASAETTPSSPAEASRLAPAARACGNVTSIAPTVTMAITAIPTLRTTVTWVWIRRAARLSSTSTRNRCSAASAITCSRAASSHPTEPMTASMISLVARSRPPSAMTVGTSSRAASSAAIVVPGQ